MKEEQEKRRCEIGLVICNVHGKEWFRGRLVECDGHRMWPIISREKIEIFLQLSIK